VKESTALPSSLRLKKRKEFLHIQSRGKKLHTRHFLILVEALTCEHSARKQHLRFGITVSRKVDKRAVIRNKIKRRVREVFRLHQHKVKSPINIVVIARTNASLCTFKEAEAEILKALQQHGFLNNPEI